MVGILPPPAHAVPTASQPNKEPARGKRRGEDVAARPRLLQLTQDYCTRY